jgi:hypothetical protein
MSITGFLGNAWAIFAIIIALLSGVLAVLREIQLMYVPAKANDKKTFWAFARIAFVLAAVLLYLDEQSKVKQLLAKQTPTPIQITVQPAQVVLPPPVTPSQAGNVKPPRLSIPAKPKVTSSVPPIVPPPSNSPTPPPQNVELVSQENTSSDRPQFQFMLKVVVVTHAAIQPVAFAFKCDGRIELADTRLGEESMTVLIRSREFLASIKGEPADSNDVYFTQWESPAFTPSTPLIVELYSNTKIRVTEFQQMAYRGF